MKYEEIIDSLVCLIIAGYRDRRTRGIAVWAAVALGMMLVGSIGTGVVPPEYFGIVERFSVFAAVGFNAMLGWYLFNGFRSITDSSSRGEMTRIAPAMGGKGAK